jgi:hypothetical protein
VSVAACIGEIVAASGGKLGDEQARELLEKTLRRAERIGGIGAPTLDSIRAAAQELGGEARLAGLIEKRNRYLNLVARIGRRERIAATGDIEQGFKREIHGDATPTAGGRYSAEGEWKSRALQLQAGAVGELERAGLLRAARSGALERQWARELAEQAKGPAGKPGISGSEPARQIAQIFHKYQTLAKRELNRAGGAIGDYFGYIARTAHDADRIRRVGLTAWTNIIRPLLDERTFDGVEDREEFLNNVYHALITGVHLTHDGMQGFKDPEFTGPGNLAKRVSQERVLHFTDADAWYDYHRQFGGRTLMESVMGNLDRSARAAALMGRFGTNPRAAFFDDLRYFAETRRNSDPALADRLGKQAATQRGNLVARFDFLDGTANMPQNRLGARIGATLRTIESMAKLGLVAFTHLSVGMTKAAELRYQGIGLFKGYGDFVHSIWRGRGWSGSAEREIMDLLLAGHEGMLHDVLSRFQIDDTLPGTLSKAANTFFKWSGLTYLVDAQRAGGEFTMSRHLGGLLDTAHDALPEATQRIMKMFGIGPREWELLRRAPDHPDIDGRKFLTPDAVMRVPDDALIAHLYDTGAVKSRLLNAPNQRMLDAARQDLSLRLHAYFNDRSAHMVIVPGIATRADLLRGTRPGTIEGEALRFFAQFKTWPAALVRQAIGRELYGGQSKAAAIAGILHMALGGTLLGYGIMTLKDLIKGKNPRDPESPKTWLAALMQGGGLGIFGDFLFGEYDRFGHPLSESIAGPVAGEGLDSVVDLWNGLKQLATGEAKDPEKRGRALLAEGMRTILDNTPFANLLFVRTALNYLFLYQVQEALNPGFLRRMERRTQQQNHQTFWLRPSAAVGR